MDVGIAIFVTAGLLCFIGDNCVDVPYNTMVYITDDMNLIKEKCESPVVGCAIINEKEIWVVKSQGGWKYIYAIIFHELLHHEYYAKNREVGHTKEFIARENALRKELGLPPTPLPS